jgi:transcriptional regulator with XRE-family HTH domain
MSASVDPLSTNIDHPIFLVNRRIDIDLGKNALMNKLGSRIRAARKDAGMTQVELARKAGITQPTLSDLENGHSDSTSSLIDLAIALGVRPEWLATGKGDREAPSVGVGVNTTKEITEANVLGEISRVIAQLQVVQIEIDRAIQLAKGLPGLYAQIERSYGGDVSPFHDLNREVAERLQNLRPEVTRHAKPENKSSSNKT